VRSLVFEGQVLHGLLAVALVVGALAISRAVDDTTAGAWLGVPSAGWLRLGIAVAIAHQVWVCVWWRLEYHLAIPSRALGARAFRIYAAGFAVLAICRIFTVVALGVANHDTFAIPEGVRWPLVVVMGALVAWLFDSVHRYFGFEHAVGADHFFESHRSQGICREGIFRYLPNAMYTVGFLILWAPAIGCRSSGAVLLAAFNHAYIWVHYLATERPDMRRIYGKPSRSIEHGS
jgi:hypothetical protein